MQTWIKLMAAAFAVAAPLSAQVVHTRTTTGRVAGTTTTGENALQTPAAPPPTFIIVAGEQLLTPPIEGTVIFANIPAFVLLDGRVFANFGRGIEQVVRPCGAILNSMYGMFYNPDQPVVEQPTVVQPTPGATQPPPFQPSIPNEPPFSQQVLVQALAMGPVPVNPYSCWAANRVGKVFVTRP